MKNKPKKKKLPKSKLKPADVKTSDFQTLSNVELLCLEYKFRNNL